MSIPKIIFSKTVKFFASIKCWCTIPIPKFIASLGEVIFDLFSNISIFPESGLTIPYRIFIRVDFPAPFSPTIACMYPDLIFTVTSEFAKTPGYVLVTFSIFIARFIFLQKISVPEKTLERI